MPVMMFDLRWEWLVDIIIPEASYLSAARSKLRFYQRARRESLSIIVQNMFRLVGEWSDLRWADWKERRSFPTRRR